MSTELNEPIGILGKIKHKAQMLVTRHGAEVGVCAKIAVATFMPGGGGMPEVIRALCDYVGQKDQNAQSDEHILELLGELKNDQTQIATVMEHLNQQFGDILTQMTGMARFNVPEEALNHLVESAIATRQDLTALRQELMELQPELSLIQAQNDRMLRQQALAGDVLNQVKDSVSAALGFCGPLLSEGVPADKTLHFLQAHMKFQRFLLRGDLSEAHAQLNVLKSISATSDTIKVCEIALKTIQRDFEEAENIAQTLSTHARSNSRVRQMTRSVASLTRGIRQGVQSPQPSPPIQTQNRVNTHIGDRGWRLQAQLGQGGMGEVWAVENRHREKGALKLMSRSLSANTSFVRRFESEILALKRIQHPTVVEILDWGQDHQGAWYFVMELIEGVSLGSRLKQSRLDETEAYTLLKTLLKGLIACHDAGVIHRDLKPDNIMLRSDGSPVLIDFGIAHQEGTTDGHSRVATIQYAPPEQLRGEPVGPEADLYALGQTIAESLGGWRAVPERLMNILERLTHNLPERRGKAKEWLNTLEQGSEIARFHITQLGGQTEGPLTLSEVLTQILNGSNQLHVWWPEASDWTLWSDMSEIRQAVEHAQAIKTPTPPPFSPSLSPPPPPIVQIHHKAGDLISRSVKGIEFKMVWCPAGEFWMGSDEVISWTYQGKPQQSTAHQPRHRVQISEPFLMGQTQVTQALYEAVMGTNPSEFKNEQRPVEKVSWFDLVLFCNRLSALENLRPAYSIGSGDQPNVELDLSANGYRLPTEAEWEYAAKAGTESTYAGAEKLHKVAWYGFYCDDQYFPYDSYKTARERSTSLVAQKMPNTWGLYDMSGNVWEWCSDQWDEKAYQSRTKISIDPCNYASAPAWRVFRGGGWGSDAVNCRVAHRGGSDPDRRGFSLGGRLLRWNLDS